MKQAWETSYEERRRLRKQYREDTARIARQRRAEKEERAVQVAAAVKKADQRSVEAMLQAEKALWRESRAIEERNEMARELESLKGTLERLNSAKLQDGIERLREFLLEQLGGAVEAREIINRACDQFASQAGRRWTPIPPANGADHAHH